LTLHNFKNVSFIQIATGKLARTVFMAVVEEKIFLVDDDIFGSFWLRLVRVFFFFFFLIQLSIYLSWMQVEPSLFVSSF